MGSQPSCSPELQSQLSDDATRQGRSRSVAVMMKLFVGALALVALAACGEDKADLGEVTTTAAATTTTAAGTSTTAAATTTAAASLADSLKGTFVATDVTGFTLVPGTQVEVTFDGANISANAGCNTMSGTWTLDGDVLVVPPMAQTLMACTTPGLGDQETWLAAVLTSKPTVAVDGDTLTITAKGSTVTMEAKQDRPLEGVAWTVEGVEANGAIQGVSAGGRTPTIEFTGGNVAVDTGCNLGGGTYTLGNGTVTFGPMRLTRAACTDPAAQQVEQAMMTVLTGTATYAIDGDTLTLTNGATALHLRAATTPASTTTTTG
jgi:heat shock protein HslJ